MIAQPDTALVMAALKTLIADQIRDDVLGGLPLTIAISGWRSTAALLLHASNCADAGDYLNAERNRILARGEFIAANDSFRQFKEAKRSEADLIAAEACR